MIGVALRRRMINLCQQWLALRQSMAKNKAQLSKSRTVDVIISSSIKQSHVEGDNDSKKPLRSK